MTPVRGKRGRRVHATYDARKTLCGKRCDGWFVEDAIEKVDCESCRDAMTTN